MPAPLWWFRWKLGDGGSPAAAQQDQQSEAAEQGGGGLGDDDHGQAAAERTSAADGCVGGNRDGCGTERAVDQQRAGGDGGGSGVGVGAFDSIWCASAERAAAAR
jgi:hypothetical protein